MSLPRPEAPAAEGLPPRNREGYRVLDSGAIVRTADRLAARISERFPNSGLRAVALEVGRVAREAEERAETIAKPWIALRIAGWGLSLCLLAAFAYAVLQAPLPRKMPDLANFMALTEAAANVIVLGGATILFLVTSERRLRNRRALAAIHELRAIAHVIDMHQLTKGPMRGAGLEAQRTQSSPKYGLEGFDLVRYLDYCSEMFSLLGKVAAIYPQHLDDEPVLSAVNEVEALTTGLARKVWQKIMIVRAGEVG